VAQARAYEANYNRVLKEKNALRELSKGQGYELD